MILKELFDDIALISGQWFRLSRNRLILLADSRNRSILQVLRRAASMKTKGPAAMAAGPSCLYFYYSGLGEIVGQVFLDAVSVQSKVT